MLSTPPPSQFAWRTSNIATTRPAAALGTVFVPGNNVKGAWTQVLPALAREALFLSLYVNSLSGTGQARDALMDVGIDPGGGSDFSVLIPNLLVSNASLSSFSARGVNYRFPIRIPAGASVGVRGAVNNASVGTPRVVMRAFGSPRDRSLVHAGAKVTAYGITEASSSGTPIVSGTTSEGAWTEIAAIARDAWHWSLGFGVNTTPLVTQIYHLDLAIGDATKKDIAIEDLVVITGSGQTDVTKVPEDDGLFRAVAGQTLYARMQCSGTPAANLSVAAYGLEG